MCIAGGKSFDHIIIETTGLADPAPVAQTFFVDEEMKAMTRLDSIVTFIDARFTGGHLDEVKPEGVENEAHEQVAFADVLVVNKTDLITPEELEALKKKLKAINVHAPIIETQYSRAPIDQVRIAYLGFAGLLALPDALGIKVGFRSLTSAHSI